ncbi:MAG: hypothetical protein AB3N63_03300 [Puniceicoccaceae bacterium]
MSQKMIRTIEEAATLIEELTVCAIFGSSKSDIPSLWDHVDLPDKKPGEKGWGEKMGAVWTWKNQLPADYPEDIFYGKIKGGIAVLMAMQHLRQVHFPEAYKDVTKLNPLAQFIHEKIRIEPWDTTHLRNLVVEEYGCSKSQFDTALKHLQISLNIVRVNDADFERDTWVLFNELYPDIWNQYVGEDA